MEPPEKPMVEPKLFVYLAALLLLWIAFLATGPQEVKPGPPEEVTVSFKAIAGSQTVLDKSLEVETGANAFDLMQEAAIVGYKDYGEMGVFIESINGVKPKPNQFWKLFVNGKEATAGISSITIEEDTAIEWRIEEIESYGG